ncbi:MAG: methyltransferase domain-containing protein [Dokdonella sp.]|uniref:class I SAM-dependent methyltransferase n=1 Tax=Dokdonella sp. TaxID=2291710 RepID=UPI0025C69FBF|nr:methyltransferase domain-containing protein [Dokdonella sp.]MBZ0222790.1 methyltransferase domain-containing protein [Dokdonella sp.]
MQLDELESLFTQAGGTDLAYLRHHWQRYCQTRRELESNRPLPAEAKILDVGAHWLHQAALYAVDGHKVHALDLPLTLTLPQVEAAAHKLGITLLCNSDLERIPSLSTVPDDSFDLVLFAEILEHITFNPVQMWREIYRVTKPGGRIVVTTPNYYAARGRLWTPRRFLARLGGGIEVHEVLGVHTYGHHWKEYSLREVIKYFTLLSADFNCIKAKCVHEYNPGYLGTAPTFLTRLLESTFAFLRPCLHVEICVEGKSGGIRVEPHW